MATVHPLRTPVKHYAHLSDVEGIATLVQGGYAFRADATGERRLVAYNDVELVLHGRVEDAPADAEPLWKKLADPGYYNGTCGRDMVRGR